MKKLIASILMGLLCLQVCAFAQTDQQTQFPMETIQPRGTYLWKGSTAINPGSGYVTVSGNTKCFSICSEVKVTMVLYQEVAPNIWEQIWEQTYSAYNAREVYSPYINVPVGAGRYKVAGNHYAINGITEYNYSETYPVTVY